MKLNPYPKYKDSGIEWLGEVPEHWEYKRLKNILTNKVSDGPHETPEFIDEGIPFLSADSIQDGQLVFDNCRYISSEDHERFKIKSTICLNDILMCKAASTGKIARVKTSMEFSVWSPLAIIKANNKIALSAYLEYVLKSSLAQSQIDVLCTSNTQFNISMDDIPKIVMPLPKLNEQKNIASFLDRETSRIDALIQKKERLIELLKEKRIALITQFVTKGLDPNVPMKTSGIKWLGEVPEHWSVKRLKYLSSCNDESLPESTDPDFEMLYVDISSVTRIEGITNKEEMRFEDAPSRARRRVRDGDTIVSTVRTYLRAIAPIENAEDNLIVSTGFAVLRPVNICSDYLSLIIQSHYVVESIVARSVGVSYPAINASDIGDIRITIPPTSEQHDIVDKVRKAILQIDTLQSKNEHSITLLREYRSSLIHHAVTGKIDLRGHDAQAQ